MPSSRFLLAAALPVCWGLSLAAAQVAGRSDNPSLVQRVAPLTRAVLERDLVRTRQLLQSGEDPNEKDDQGFSPWMWAVNFEENDALTLLLSRVDAIPVSDVLGRRRLAVAASLNNLVAVRALLSKGVPVDSPAIDGATPLLVAAESGYTDLIGVLLDAGADPRSPDQHGDTPMMAAVRIGSIDAARTLLRADADLNARDRAGRTALHWAARSGRADIVRALLDAGAPIDDTDDAGRSPLAYAQAKGYLEAANLLKRRGALGPSAVPPRLTPTPREAVAKSVPLLLQGWHSWSEHRTCGGCHHRLMIDRVAALAARAGFPDAARLADDERQFFNRNATTGEVQLRQQLATPEGVFRSAIGIFGDGSSGDALNLNTVLELGVARSAGLEARALLLARKQLEDGSWRTGLPRVPILSSDFAITAAAARTIAAYSGSADAVDISERVERARRWLVTTHPVTTDDKASRLLGLRWTHADDRSIERAAGLLKSEQHVDGGWSQLDGVNSDAYATGMVLMALRWGIDLGETDPAYSRGVDYLLRTQEADGSWLVPKRAAASNEYFESGFPHGKFQFISYAGSCWATMALLDASASQSRR
jgi:ankyrin repeat protein